MDNNHSYPKTTFASDAFYTSMLGQEITMTVQQMGTATYKLHQVDQFTLIVETEDAKHLLIAKAGIIAVEAADTALPAFHESVAQAVKKIQYAADKKRTEGSKHKFQKKYNNGPRYHNNIDAPQPRDYNSYQPRTNVDVQVKPKRSYTTP